MSSKRKGSQSTASKKKRKLSAESPRNGKIVDETGASVALDGAEKITHWLMKSEPESRFEKGIDVKFGIEDLKKAPDQTACWDGVRNYQARNFMRDQMKVGHKVFFYHSNTKVPGCVAVCEVAKEAYVDHTQFDAKDPHFDKSANPDNPRWFMVDVKFQRMLKRYISLAELKSIHQEHKAKGGPLKNLALFTRARLSVQPLTQEEWNFILSLEDEVEDK